ncbi:hypothetical protein LCGC14_1633330 [marine sediment metagenome]|uniref:Portal protein n=1 Tax=marine sediment metagenome TaxID=412755 RepID=A0A0F9I2A1_9ZZZZ
MVAGAPRGHEMTKEELQGIMSSEIRVSVGQEDGRISAERRENMEFYLGEPLGNEQEGRSQVVSTDVQDVIESTMPEMMEVFASGDEVVEYEPVGGEDEAIAEQATDYANHIIMKDNDGFGLIHDWIKDALLQKQGILKSWWDKTPVIMMETKSGLNALALDVLQKTPDVEVIEFDDDDVDPETGERMFAVKIKKTADSGRVRIEGVPPEQFLISRRARSLDTSPFTCHRKRITISDMYDEGYDKDEIDRMPASDDEDLNEEHQARFDNDEWPFTDQSLDPAMREVWLYECYMKLDWTGDGHASIHKVTCAGSTYHVLKDPNTKKWATEVDDHPFSAITPVRMPHKFFGRALADLVKDIQVIKTTIQRQILDNMYQINNARTEIAESHTTLQTVEDWLNNRVGGVVRTKMPGGIIPIQTTPIIDTAFPMMEYWDNVMEKRTGINQGNPGLDVSNNALNDTLGGVEKLLAQSAKRKLLMARVIAETGFKDLFKKILRIITNHQEKARVIRLRGKWVEIDPRSWNRDMDVTVNVGLGHGTKEQQIQADMSMLQMMERAIQLGAATGKPIISPENVYKVWKRFAHNMGWKRADDVVTDPESPEGQQLAQMAQQQKGPDPKMMEAQVRVKMLEMKTQADIQSDQATAQAEVQKDHAMAAAEAQKDQAMAQADADREGMRVQTDRDKTAAEVEIAKFKAEEEMAIKRWEAEQRIDIEQGKAEAHAEIARSQSEQAVGMKEREFTAGQKVKKTNGTAKPNGKSEPAPVVHVHTGSKSRTVTVERGKDGKLTGAKINDD